MADRITDRLRRLARLYGVQTSYSDWSGRRHVAGADALMTALKALGAPISGISEAEGALRERRHALRSRRLEPVIVAWDDAPCGAVLRLPEAQASDRISFLLTPEDGEPRRWDCRAGEMETVGAVESEGRRYLAKRLTLPGRLPTGYHRLAVRGGGADESEALVVVAPTRAFGGSDGPGGRSWGLFCPPYALHRASSWGGGDLGDLDALMGWVAEHRGDLISTLPMLATTFDGSPSISPYAPASRLFWNEFYLDPTRIPELAGCEAARALMESAEVRDAIAELRQARLVDYGRQMALKRRVLEALADDFFARETARHDEFRRFVRGRPEVEDYATFMAAGERHGRRRADWPEALRAPGRGGEVDERARRYHLLVQWLADEQMRGLGESARARGLTWYVDFPVGVDPDGYDAWSRPGLFVADAAIGCPPDPFSPRGQDWKFPPIHPERQREDQYRYLIAALRHHLRDAGALRLDHAAGLHRLYWIQAGGDPREGVYVRNPGEELFAILSVESHRAGAWLVGENLGTLPPGLNAAMERHEVRGMFVGQYEFRPDPASPLREIPTQVVASVNNHDLPPFAAYWGGLEIPERVELGFIDPAAAAREREARDAQKAALVEFLAGRGLPEAGRDDAGAVLRALWSYLAESPARVVLLGLEDLWLETESQNTPGTERERPNWRRKFRLAFEEFGRSPEIAEALRALAEARRSSEAQEPGRMTPRDVGSGPTAA